MRDHSPFRIPVPDLLADPGRRRPVTIDAPIEWTLELSRAGPDLHADLELQGASGGVLVRGTVETEATHTCHRCLTEWTEPIEVEMAEMLGLEGDDDGYPIDGDVADLEAPLRDAVLLAIPLSPTCRPDCRGICATCGGDLNTGSCAGHDEESDSPFAPLRELFDS
ncbi:MAG TPA: DUF177 domain-containing protein [Acidimicrobiia bacterium]|nr:DUF177 domain-containing protein [Acidimicrobiia bacterium]